MQRAWPREVPTKEWPGPKSVDRGSKRLDARMRRISKAGSLWVERRGSRLEALRSRTCGPAAGILAGGALDATSEGTGPTGLRLPGSDRPPGPVKKTTATAAATTRAGMAGRGR